jgi:hypothetical protein
VKATSLWCNALPEESGLPSVCVVVMGGKGPFSDTWFGVSLNPCAAHLREPLHRPRISVHMCQHSTTHQKP